MKKLISQLGIFVLVFSLLSVFGLTVYADEVNVSDDGDFVIVGNTLVSYTGNDTEVTLPEEISHIAKDAFAGTPNVTKIIVPSKFCGADEGAFPEGITVCAHKGSGAYTVASNSGCTVVNLTPEKVKLTVKYVYADGKEAHKSYTAELSPMDNYSVTSPEIDGFVPDFAVVEGTAEYSDITLTVTYKSTTPDGFVLSEGKIKYSENGEFVKGTTKTIGGTKYTFDSKGYLITDGVLIDIGDKTYILENQVVATGYKVIGSSIYCFAKDGAMLKNTSTDGNSFDASGAMIGNDKLVTIGTSTYYLTNNQLFTGYRMTEGNITYFGADYKMVKNTKLNSYTFDQNGFITAGIKVSELEFPSLTNLQYTGKPLKQNLTVRFKGLVLTEGTHYTVKYSDNTDPGKATITVTGKGCVSGEKVLNFDILGKNSYSLTIKYVDKTGATIASEYITVIESGEKYSIPSPLLDDYSVDKPIVSGTMGKEDVTVTVTYKKLNVESDTQAEPDTEDTTGDESEETTQRPPYNQGGTGKDEPDTDDTEKESETESETEAEETVKTIVSEVIETHVKYNWDLLIKVISLATVICGGLIIVIIKWDGVKKYVFGITKKKTKKR